MTTYPDPGTPVKLIASRGGGERHTVLGVMVEHDEEKVTVRPGRSYRTVWFDTAAVESCDEIPFSDLESKIEIVRVDHPLPETVREHLVKHHGYTLGSVQGLPIDSLLDLHDVLHQERSALSHVHGLTARERDLVGQITRKDLP